MDIIEEQVPEEVTAEIEKSADSGVPEVVDSVQSPQEQPPAEAVPEADEMQVDEQTPVAATDDMPDDAPVEEAVAPDVTEEILQEDEAATNLEDETATNLEDEAVINQAEDPAEDVIPPLPLPDPAYDFRNHISAFAFSQQGESHIRKELPCQDRSGMRFLSDTVVAGAVADGVGSCMLSDYGAATAVESALTYLEEHLGPRLQESEFRMDSPFMGKLLREMMQYAYDQVSLKAEQMQQLLYSLQSTLTVAVYDGDTLYFAHAGDDGIVVQTTDGQCVMVTCRHKGEEASSVFPLQSKKTWQYGRVNDVLGFVMVTDGVLDAFVGDEIDGNRIYYPFIEPAFSTGISSLEETGAACNDWYDYMKTPQYRSSVTDDLSIVCIVNQHSRNSARKFDFDINEWNKTSQEIAERRKKALYPSKYRTPDEASNPSNAAQPPAVNNQPEGSKPVQPRHNPPAAPFPGNRPPASPQRSAPVRNIPLSPHPRSSQRTAQVLYYGRKAMDGVGNALEGVGGILLAGAGFLAEASEEALRQIKEHSGNHAETRQSRDTKNRRNNGGRNG